MVAWLLDGWMQGRMGGWVAAGWLACLLAWLPVFLLAYLFVLLVAWRGSVGELAGGWVAEWVSW